MNPIRPSLCFLAVAVTAIAAVKEEINPGKLKDKVTIIVGKDLTVQFQQQDDGLSQPKVIENAGENAATVTFSSKVISGKGAKIVSLITRHPFPKTLVFRALIRLQGEKEYKETSIVPVGKGLAGGESWSDPVEEIVLFDFKLSDKEP
jgi:hypothetical protein